MADIKYRNEKGNAAKWGRTLGAVVCALSFVVTAAGCGKAEEPIPVDLSSGTVEELQGEAPEDAAGETAQPDAGNGNSESDKPENEQPDEESDRKTTQDRLQSDSEQQTPEAQPSGNMQLEGNVQSVGADSFVICRIETWEEDGVSYAAGAAPGYEDESDLITVHVSENCSYQYKTVKNGGINPEDISEREGNFADLQEGISVDMKGSWQDDNSFRADNIVISSFE